jgi:O-antigen ligase
MIYFILPLVLISVTPFLNNPTTLVRSFILILYGLLLMVFLNKNYFEKNWRYIFLPTTILIGYTITWRLTEQNTLSFLYGSYGRNIGFLSLVGLFIAYYLAITAVNLQTNKIYIALKLTVNLSIAYGILQYLQLDPINWSNELGPILLTLGNTNFSSAFLGMISAIPLFFATIEKGWGKAGFFLQYLLIGFLITNTNSSQGFIIYLISGLYFFTLANRARILKLFELNKIQLSLLSITLIGIFALGFVYYKDFIDKSLQVTARLEHWGLAIRIIQDNFFLGVGIDNMQNYSSQYITLANHKLWGNYLHPDKSHNIVLDSFVTGGILVGTAYILFILFILLLIIRMLKSDINKNMILHLFVCIWIGYLLQIMVSPSQLVIDTLGYLAAGSIVGIYKHSIEKSPIKQNSL